MCDLLPMVLGMWIEAQKAGPSAPLFNYKSIPPMSSKVTASSSYVPPPPQPKKYFLALSDLTETEARALLAITGRIGGPEIGPRGLITEIRNALLEQGVSTNGDELVGINNMYLSGSTRE